MSKQAAKDERAAALRKDVDFVEHTWDEDKLYAHFGCTLDNGLSSERVLENRAKYGENRLTPPEVTPWYIKFIEEMTGRVPPRPKRARARRRPRSAGGVGRARRARAPVARVRGNPWAPCVGSFRSCCGARRPRASCRTL